MANRNSPSVRGVALVLGVLALFILILSFYYFAQSVSLRNTSWRLVAINGHPPLDGHNLLLTFTDNRMGGNTFCGNGFSGYYTITAEGKLVLTHVIMTRRPCIANDITAQDGVYLDTLFGAPTFKVQGDRLEFYNAAGQPVLVYARP